MDEQNHKSNRKISGIARMVALKYKTAKEGTKNAIRFARALGIVVAREVVNNVEEVIDKAQKIEGEKGSLSDEKREDIGKEPLDEIEREPDPEPEPEPEVEADPEPDPEPEPEPEAEAAPEPEPAPDPKTEEFTLEDSESSPIIIDRENIERKYRTS